MALSKVYKVITRAKCHEFVKESRSSSRCTYERLRRTADDSRIYDDNEEVLSFRDVDNSPTKLMSRHCGLAKTGLAMLIDFAFRQRIFRFILIFLQIRCMSLLSSNL